MAGSKPKVAFLVPLVTVAATAYTGYVAKRQADAQQAAIEKVESDRKAAQLRAAKSAKAGAFDPRVLTGTVFGLPVWLLGVAGAGVAFMVVRR